MERHFKIILLILLLFGFLFVLPFIGGTEISFSNLFEKGSPSYRIVFELRLPRVILALLIGAALAVLGGTYQILFHNSLAEPYILGVSNAAILGVALSEIIWKIPSHSFLGTAIGFFAAMAATLLMLLIYLSRMGNAMHRLILFGMGMQFVLSSVLFLLLSYYSQHMGGGSLRWLFGQIPWLDFGRVVVFSLICFPMFVFFLAFSRHLDALGLGDSISRTLGFSPVRTRAVFLVVSSAFVALVVSFVGAIGFVGLVIPHVVRLVFHPSSTRVLFLYCFLLGGCFLSFSDIISRMILPPFEFPIGIITTLIGGPIFLYLLWKH